MHYLILIPLALIAYVIIWAFIINWAIAFNKRSKQRRATYIHRKMSR